MTRADCLHVCPQNSSRAHAQDHLHTSQKQKPSWKANWHPPSLTLRKESTQSKTSRIRSTQQHFNCTGRCTCASRRNDQNTSHLRPRTFRSEPRRPVPAAHAPLRAAAEEKHQQEQHSLRQHQSQRVITHCVAQSKDEAKRAHTASDSSRESPHQRLPFHGCRPSQTHSLRSAFVTANTCCDGLVGDSRNRCPELRRVSGKHSTTHQWSLGVPPRGDERKCMLKSMCLRGSTCTSSSVAPRETGNPATKCVQQSSCPGKGRLLPLVIDLETTGKSSVFHHQRDSRHNVKIPQHCQDLQPKKGAWRKQQQEFFTQRPTQPSLRHENFLPSIRPLCQLLTHHQQVPQRCGSVSSTKNLCTQPEAALVYQASSRKTTLASVTLPQHDQRHIIPSRRGSQSPSPLFHQRPILQPQHIKGGLIPGDRDQLV